MLPMLPMLALLMMMLILMMLILQSRDECDRDRSLSAVSVLVVDGSRGERGRAAQELVVIRQVRQRQGVLGLG